tara:strand:- start:437 stop:640 length:204 start_codon:yes stop_codon:yes gene_type:complete
VSDVLTHALDQASDELGLQSYYRDLVRPIIKLPRKQWPECCGGNCEPCAQVLVAVAQRVQELLADQA